MLVNGTKLKIEMWISKHPSNPIKIGKRKNQGVYIPFLKKMMYNIAVLKISRYIKIGDTMKMGKAGNQHSYFVEKHKGKSKDFAKGKGKVSNT